MTSTLRSVSLYKGVVRQIQYLYKGVVYEIQYLWCKVYKKSFSTVCSGTVLYKISPACARILNFYIFVYSRLSKAQFLGLLRARSIVRKGRLIRKTCDMRNNFEVVSCFNSFCHCSGTSHCTNNGQKKYQCRRQHLSRLSSPVIEVLM
jgi:hypothetical protein